MKAILTVSTFVVCLMLVGCGGSGGEGVRLKGVVQERGAAVSVDSSKEVLEVTFLFKDKDGKDRRESAKVGSDGAFDLTKGPPAGTKVKIGLQHVPAYDKKGPAKTSAHFAPFAPETTPLTYDVGSEGTQEIVIDLTSKTVKKKS